MENKNIRKLVFAAILCVMSVALQAGEFDSSSPLPAMTAASLATKTAGKAFTDYAASRQRENAILADLYSPAFEKQPYQQREIKRANYLVELSRITVQQNEQLKTYKKYVASAATALREVGPGQIAAAQSQLEGMRRKMTVEIGRQSVTAGAMADAARLGGLSPQQDKQFRNYVDQLRRKQAMEERLQAESGKMQGAATTMDAFIDYLDGMQADIDLAIIDTDIARLFNEGAKAKQKIEVGLRELCGGSPCDSEKMFRPGPDHSQLMGGFTTEQAEVEGEGESTEDYIQKYARR